MATDLSASDFGLQQDQFDELVQNFGEFDLDGNGHITTKELGAALEAVGEKVPGYQLREMIAKIDQDKNGTIELNEFIRMYCDRKSKEIANTFKRAITKKSGIEAKGGQSEASSAGTTHSFSEEEKVAFADWINSNLGEDPDLKGKLLPIDPQTNQLFQRVADGILLCKMINLSAPDTIDERAINKGKLSVYTKHENLTLALNSAMSIGCSVVNIGADDLTKGTEHLVLGLLWQIIRIGLFANIDLQHHPGLVCLLQEGESLDDLLRLPPEDILIRWVNYQMEQAGQPRRIHNFSGDIKDSEVYTYLLKQIAPKETPLDLSPLNEYEPEARAEKMLQNADKIGCRQFVSPKDVARGYSKLNMAFVANLFNMYPNLQPPEDMEDMEIIEETREEKTFRNWMNSLGVNPYVHHLYNDLCDGLVLLQLFEMVKPGSVEWEKRVNSPPWSKLGGNMKKLENCNYCVELGKSMKFSLVGIGGEDIYQGNQLLTLAIVWQLMRAYTLRILQQLAGSDKPIGDGEIVQWVNQKLQSASKERTIRSFQDPTISDSLVVIDLVDAIKPGAVNYKNVRQPTESLEDKMANAKYAISMSRKIGAPVYALPEDLAEVKPKMVMTVFACLMARGSVDRG